MLIPGPRGYDEPALDDFAPEASARYTPRPVPGRRTMVAMIQDCEVIRLSQVGLTVEAMVAEVLDFGPVDEDTAIWEDGQLLAVIRPAEDDGDEPEVIRFDEPGGP